MPQVLVHLIDKCHEPELNLAEIAGIIDKDATITAKLLQLVNSAFVGARRSFTNIEQAVVYLGGDTIRNLAISLSVQQVFRRVESNGLLSVDRFWHHSLANALLARNIAVTAAYNNPSEAYLAGLLHDIGKLLLWMAFPGKYAPLLLKGVRCHHSRLAFLEEEKLQVNHCSAGAWLCEEWRLPTLLADAIRYHHHPLEEVEQALPLVRIASLADLLSHSSGKGEDCLEAADRLFGLTSRQVHDLYEGVDEQIDLLADQLGIHIPRNSRTSHDQEPESQETHKETSLGLINRIREITQMSGLIDNLLRAENSHQVVVAVEQGLKILFNEDACLLLVLDRRSGDLLGMTSPDNKLSRELNGFSFTPQRYSNSLPGKALLKQRLAHTFDQAKEEGATSLFDAQLLRLLGTEGMVAVPMIFQHELLGLLLVGLSGKAFQHYNNQWTPLRLLANHAAMSFYMEQMHAIQAEQLADERMQAANLTARKIAHEINNPLATLRNYVHIIRKKSEQGHTIDEELAILDNELERLGQVTLGLEDLSREYPQVHPERLDVHRLVGDILHLFQASTDASQLIEFSFSPWTQSIFVDADRGCLNQILQNLLGNATDALVGQEGTITIRTEIDAATARISVEDSGPGIDPSIAATLFTAGASTKGEGHGGLGLAIAQKLAHQMGGRISHFSQPGKTIFTLELPLQDACVH